MVRSDPPFSADLIHLDGSVVFRLVGELDIATVPLLRDAVDAVINQHLQAVILDLGELTFVDVVGLRGLLHVGQTAKIINAEFTLRCVTERTLGVIRLVGFAELERATEPLPADAL